MLLAVSAAYMGKKNGKEISLRQGAMDF